MCSSDLCVVVDIDEPILEHRREREPRQRRKGHRHRHRHRLGYRNGRQFLPRFHPQLPSAAAFAPDPLRAPRHGRFIRKGDSSHFLAWHELSLRPRAGARQPRSEPRRETLARIGIPVKPGDEVNSNLIACSTVTACAAPLGTSVYRITTGPAAVPGTIEPATAMTGVVI